MEENHVKRHYGLDWIRVTATFMVFLYHCSMFFNPFPWHIKNNELNASYILVFSLFVGAWIMPIFFAISGISVSSALKKRNSAAYIKERFIRLGIPLVFGVLILTPPQIYVERIINNQFKGSYLDFFPHFFDGIYLDFGGTGNFAFFGLHLWYLLVLLVFSLLTIPLFKWVRNPVSLKKIHFVLLPFFLITAGSLKTQNLGGWDLIFYLLIFIYGFYFFSSENVKPLVSSTISLHAILAVLTTFIYIVWFMKGFPQPGSFENIIFYGVRTINCWSLLLCIFYLADQYLSFSNRYLAYGSEVSMPFYVLHQPVIILIAFLIRDFSWSIPIKLIFLISVSFTLIMLSYHFVIRHFAILRVLFGMRSIRKSAVKKEAA